MLVSTATINWIKWYSVAIITICSQESIEPPRFSVFWEEQSPKCKWRLFSHHILLTSFLSAGWKAHTSVKQIARWVNLLNVDRLEMLMGYASAPSTRTVRLIILHTVRDGLYLWAGITYVLTEWRASAFPTTFRQTRADDLFYIQLVWTWTRASSWSPTYYLNQ